MANEIWISNALSNGELSNKLGIGAKYFGYDWEEPTHIVPPKPDKVLRDLQRQSEEDGLEREDFPEACYVFDQKRFRNCKDLFFLGGFAAVKGRLADVLASANLGTGRLVQIPVFEANKKTKIPGPFFAVNFGVLGSTFCPGKSTKIRPILTLERHGKERWRTYANADYEIAVFKQLAEDKIDFWIDPKLRSAIFLSGDLVNTIKEAQISVNYLELLRCRIVD